MRKIPRRYAVTLTASLMAFIMSSVISGILSVLAAGFTFEAWTLFAARVPMAFLVAWPTAVVVLPLVRKVVERVTE